MKKGKKVAVIVTGILLAVVLVVAILAAVFMMRSQKLIEELDFSSFYTTDLEGNEITQEIFRDYDVTMINVWATWCEPCREEMPEIQKAYEQLPENANIISVCMDANGNEALAAQIAEKAGIKFEVLIAKDILADQVNGISSFPTTVFVDSEGHSIGEPIIGVRSGVDVTQFYLENINGLLP